MALYTDDLVRAVFHGEFLDGPDGDPVEEFVHTLMFKLHKDTGSNTDWGTFTPELAASLRDKWDSHWTNSVADLFPSIVRYTRVDTYHLDTAGHALDHGIATFPVDGVRGAANFSLPPEVATCVSLRGVAGADLGLNKGRRRGRFYLPPVATSTVTYDGSIEPTKQFNMLSWITNTLNDFQGIQAVFSGTPAIGNTTHFDLVVASSVDGSYTQVNEVRLGRVLDVQRRRRRSLPEAYLSQPLVNH